MVARDKEQVWMGWMWWDKQKIGMLHICFVKKLAKTKDEDGKLLRGLGEETPYQRIWR